MGRQPPNLPCPTRNLPRLPPHPQSPTPCPQSWPPPCLLPLSPTTWVGVLGSGRHLTEPDRPRRGVSGDLPAWRADLACLYGCMWRGVHKKSTDTLVLVSFIAKGSRSGFGSMSNHPKCSYKACQREGLTGHHCAAACGRVGMHRAGRHASVVGAGTALQDKASLFHDCRLLTFGCVPRSSRCSLRLPKVSARGVLHLESCFAHLLPAERSRPRLLHARRLGSPTDAAHSVLEPMMGAPTRCGVLSFHL